MPINEAWLTELAASLAKKKRAQRLLEDFPRYGYSEQEMALMEAARRSGPGMGAMRQHDAVAEADSGVGRTPLPPEYGDPGYMDLLGGYEAPFLNMRSALNRSPHGFTDKPSAPFGYPEFGGDVYGTVGEQMMSMMPEQPPLPQPAPRTRAPLYQGPGPGERVPEWEYTPDYDNRYPLSSKAERASRGGATGRQASRNVQPPVPDPTRKIRADLFQSIDRGQGEEFIVQRRMEQILRGLQDQENFNKIPTTFIDGR